MKPLFPSLPLYIITAVAAGTLALAAPASAQLIPSTPLDDFVRPPVEDPLLEDPFEDIDGQLEQTIEEPLDEEPLGDPLDESAFDDALGENPLGESFGEGVLDGALGEGGVADLPGDGIGVPLEDEVETITAPLDDALGGTGTVLEEVAGTVDAAGESLAGAAQSAVSTALAPVRPFVETVDPFGHAIEKDVLMLLVEPGALAALERSGWPVAAARELPSLGLVLARIEKPAAPSLAQAAGDLRDEFPGAAVDYNFLYRFAEGERDEQARAASGDAPDVRPGAGVRLGLIDSAVATEHPALSDVNVVARDFAPHEGERPLGHGTAVAGILAASAGERAEILAASVFFQTPGRAPGATTESLIAALDWLAGSDADVINMSLAGPADDLLERALASLATGGPTVVAAVGNNGPKGAPLYPAAYDTVVGVTAIDRERRIFAYANRGEHVAFAAPGVNVKVANGPAGWRLESGTSMASPHVAAVIGRALRETGLPAEALLEALAASAVDLGDEGFDPVFGHGLVQAPDAQNAAASLAE